MQTRLIINGPEGKQDIQVNPGGITFGRDESCDIVLNHRKISRVHARLSRDPFGRWIMEDLDSHNGVYIDGQRIKAQAVLSGQKINLAYFEITLVEDTPEAQPDSTSKPFKAVLDHTTTQHIESYYKDPAHEISPELLRGLNEMTSELLQLESPEKLYSKACSSLAKMLKTLVLIVQLPHKKYPLSDNPVIIASDFGQNGNVNSVKMENVYLSRRVLDAIRSSETPIKASSGGSAGSDAPIQLTLVDTCTPHIVFAAQVLDTGKTIDALYVDILAANAFSDLFDFIEMAARQINFAQKNLFYIELQKKEKALREANEQLKQKDRIKDEYVSRVTHDIKGHLATMQTCLIIAGDSTIGTMNEKQKDFHDRVVKRAELLMTFVQDLLNLTRMRLSGTIEMKAFSLRDTIAEALNAITEKADEKSLKVTSYIAPSVENIVGNQFSIKEVITNLLFNSVKYTPENKTLHLEAGCNDEQVQIDITDTGIGIPEDDLPRLFDEFFRAGNARKSNIEGTGLGLSIVKQIVEQHGGAITARSTLGVGSTFTITLPLKP